MNNNEDDVFGQLINNLIANKPTYNQQAAKNYEKVAKTSAFLDAIQLLTKTLGGIGGATVNREEPNRVVPNALNMYNNDYQKFKNDLDRWNSIYSNIMLQKLANDKWQKQFDAEQQYRNAQIDMQKLRTLNSKKITTSTKEQKPFYTLIDSKTGTKLHLPTQGDFDYLWNQIRNAYLNGEYQGKLSQEDDLSMKNFIDPQFKNETLRKSLLNKLWLLHPQIYNDLITGKTPYIPLTNTNNLMPQTNTPTQTSKPTQTNTSSQTSTITQRQPVVTENKQKANAVKQEPTQTTTRTDTIRGKSGITMEQFQDLIRLGQKLQRIQEAQAKKKKNK